MAVETTTKVRVNVKLDNGNNKTVSVSLGTLDKDSFDKDKAFSIVQALSRVFDKDLSSVEKVVTSELVSD